MPPSDPCRPRSAPSLVDGAPALSSREHYRRAMFCQRMGKHQWAREHLSAANRRRGEERRAAKLTQAGEAK